MLFPILEDMNFFKRTKKFLEPVYVFPKDVFWNACEGFLQAFYFIFSFEILRIILNLLLKWETEKLPEFILWYGLVALAIIVSKFLLYKKWWTEITLEGTAYYYSKYIGKFITADGNLAEKIGTGRFISTLKRGLDAWLDDLYNLTQAGITNIVIILYITYFVIRIDVWFAILLLILDVTILIVAIPVNKWIREKRLKRYESEKEADRLMTMAWV